MTELERWLKEAERDKALEKGLKKQSKEEREDAFLKELTFGTGGMRGIMGYGPNRMSIYTLRKANYGLAKYLIKKYKSDIARGVVISHDNRLNSREFAFESAKVLTAFGIKCFMFDDLRTTPELSFAVRYLKAISGVMITASHNPPKYNGYKIYDEDGCQYTPEYADKIIEEINTCTDLFSIKTVDTEVMKSTGLLKILGQEVDDAFLKAVHSVELFKDNTKKIKIVYTPLHGTGALAGKRALEESGYDVSFVKEQMEHDPYFSTLKLPNPEDPQAFKLAEILGKKIKADLLIATDPDADRVGIAVFDGTNYQYFTGNQTGALLLYFRLTRMKEMGILPKKGRVFNTIVTSELGAKIAKSFGFNVTSTLTGFKYIGEQAKLLEKTDEEYIFGYEESYGYLIKDYCRDKDSIQSLLAIAEMANWYLVNEGRNLSQVMEEIYKTYGYFREYTRNLAFEGKNGDKTMSSIMSYFRNGDIRYFAGNQVLMKEDYLLSERTSGRIKTKISLPKSDVIKYYLTDDAWIVVRPSGTEPKLKIYYAAKGENIIDSSTTLKNLDDDMYSRIKEFTTLD